MPHEFSTDTPIQFPVDDQLDRSIFSREIACTLTKWRSKETLVVSLCGEWGSGKTTLCNFIKHYLREDDPKALLVDFNPWEWSAQDKIFEGFFRQIGALFGRKDTAKSTRRLLNRWRWLAVTLKSADIARASIPPWMPALIGVPALVGLGIANYQGQVETSIFASVICGLALVSPLLKMPEEILKLLRENKPDETLDDLRDKLGEDLTKLDKPIIVFIDDIDRLTTPEIALLFQLIKANIQLPNFIFFLMFHKSVVAEAIGKSVSEDGSKYLRKIVQVEWETPIPFEDQIQSIFTKGLNEVLSEGRPKLEWDSVRWSNLFTEGIWPYFSNMRDIKRFLGSFRFYFRLQLQGNVLEVNPIDLLAIEVLRVFDHRAYISLAKMSGWGAQSRMKRIWRGKEMNKEMKLKLDAIKAVEGKTTIQKAALVSILESLFPGHYDEGGSRDAFLKELRICHHEHFSKYFRGELDSRNAIASHWEEFITRASDRIKAVDALREAMADGKLEPLLNHLFASRSEVSTGTLLPLITALFDTGDEFPRRRVGIGLFDAENTLFRFIHFRLLDEPEASRVHILKSALLSTTGFSLPLRFISNEDNGTRTRHPDMQFIFPPGEVSWLQSHGLGLIKQKAVEGTLMQGSHAGSALYHWDNWGSQQEVSDWLSSFANTPQHGLIVLKTLMSASGPGDGSEQPLFISSAFERYLNIDLLKALVNQVPDCEQTDEDRLRIRLLEEAVGRKQSGQPYGQINVRDLEAT